MLKKINENSTIGTATQGSIHKECFQFKSDKPLTGFPIHVDIGLWSKLDNLGKTIPTYKEVYPAAGTYLMSLDGAGLQNANLECRLIVIDSMNFVIELTYVVLADINSGITTSYKDNVSLFISEFIGSGDSVYSVTDYLSCKVTIQRPSGLEFAIFEKRFKNNKWKSATNYLYTKYYSKESQQVSGWVNDEDLYINVYPDNTADSIWYGGIIDVSANQNNKPFYQDLNLQYGKLNGTPQSAHSLFEFNKIKECKGIINDELGKAFGQFVIDKSYFQQGHSYRLFWIIKNTFGEWESYLTETINQVDTGNCTKFYPDTDVFIHYETQTPLTAPYNNIASLAPCQPFRIEIRIDEADFDAKMNAAGYSGNGLNALVSLGKIKIKPFLANTLELFPLKIADLFVYSQTFALGTYTIIAEGLLNESYAGSTKYAYLNLEIEFPEGVIELVYPYKIEVAPYGVLPNLTTTLNDYICDDVNSLEICFDGVSATDRLNIYDGTNETIKDQDPQLGTYDATFSGGDACAQIDLTKIEEDKLKCLCVYSQGTYQNPALSCPCNDLELTIDLENKKQGYDYTLTIDWSNIAALPTDAIAWALTGTIEHSPITENYPNVTVNKITLAGKWCNSTNFKNYLCFTFILTLANGCQYVIFVYPKEAGYDGSKSVYITQSGTYNIEICGFPLIETIPCNWNPRLSVVCDSFTGTMTETLDGGTLVSKWYSYDQSTWNVYGGGAVPFLSNDVIYWWVIIDPPASSFPCVQVTLYEKVVAKECKLCYDLAPINQCEDYLVITDSWATELLTLSETLDPLCAPSVDGGLKYSINGTDYFAYVAPIATNGYNYIYWYHYIECANGCSVYESGRWERECKIDPCADTGGGGCPCTVEIESIEVENNYSIDHYNPYLGTGNNSFDSQFVTETGFLERTVIKSTIRVDLLKNGDIVDTCYYSRKGYFRSSYQNNDYPMNSGEYIDSIKVWYVYPNNIFSYMNSLTINCSAIVFSGVGSTYAANLKAHIISVLNSNFIPVGSYDLEVTCTNGGVFRISFRYMDFANTTSLNYYAGIWERNAEIGFYSGGNYRFLDGNSPGTQQQGYHEYIELDPPADCTFTDDCGNTLNFNAQANGGITRPSTNYRYVYDGYMLCWFNIPLVNEPYTIGSGLTLSSVCTSYILIGLTQGFTNPITHEWKEGVTVLGTSRILEIGAGHTVTYTADDGTCNESDEIII